MHRCSRDRAILREVGRQDMDLVPARGKIPDPIPCNRAPHVRNEADLHGCGISRSRIRLTSEAKADGESSLTISCERTPRADRIAGPAEDISSINEASFWGS